MSEQPLLTIAIPTFNRASLLAHTLAAVQTQRIAIHGQDIEVLVLDNHSTDATADVLITWDRPGAPLRTIVRATNIGSDRNIADAFDQASGRYVWILSDDDLPLPGTLAWLIDLLRLEAPGLVYLRPFGYESDELSEDPAGSERIVSGGDFGRFLRTVGAHITFISAIVVDKTLISDVRAEEFVGTNLVQVEIYLSAALAATRFLTTRRYRVACKRNNSGGYDFTEVFVQRLGAILDRYVARGLSQRAADALEQTMLLRYFPQNLWIARRRGDDLGLARSRLRQRYSKRILYWLMVDPIMSLPRWMGVCFGALATTLGRVWGGDLRRGIMFAVARFNSSEKDVSK